MASLPPDMDRAIQDQIGAGLRDVAASMRRFTEQVKALSDGLDGAFQDSLPDDEETPDA